MTAKDIFLNSLCDADRGYYHAYENQQNLEDLLAERITMKQYKLFQAWKMEEQQVAQAPRKYPSFLDNPSLDQTKVITLKQMVDKGRLAVLEAFCAESPEFTKAFEQWKKQHSGNTIEVAPAKIKVSEFPPFLDYLHIPKEQDASFRLLVTNKRWNVLDAWVEQKHPKCLKDYNSWKKDVLTQN